MSSSGFAAAQLCAFVERVERVHEEKKSLEDDIRDIYAEAKANGFDVKALKTIIKRRRVDPDELAEHEAIVETYLNALKQPSRSATTRAREEASTPRETATA
jgi:uncharacterized protein (UPF0335 family)